MDSKKFPYYFLCFEALVVACGTAVSSRPRKICVYEGFEQLSELGLIGWIIGQFTTAQSEQREGIKWSSCFQVYKVLRSNFHNIKNVNLVTKIWKRQGTLSLHKSISTIDGPPIRNRRENFASKLVINVELMNGGVLYH